MTDSRKLVLSKGKREPSSGRTSLTTTFWRCLQADAKCSAYWTRYSETRYLEGLKDEPMPGVWLKYTVRVDIAMAIFETLEQRDKGVPAGFFRGDAEIDIQGVDGYAIAERLLSDAVVQRIDAGGGSETRAGSRRGIAR